LFIENGRDQVFDQVARKNKIRQLPTPAVGINQNILLSCIDQIFDHAQRNYYRNKITQVCTWRNLFTRRRLDCVVVALKSSGVQWRYYGFDCADATSNSQ